MKKKSFFAPSQMMILTDIDIGGDGDTSQGMDAKPGIITDDDSQIVIPTGEGVQITDGDIDVAPDAGIAFSNDADDAYY